MPESKPSSPAEQKKPWPMRWVVVAIVGFIGLYTFISFHFRKEDAAHLPYEAAQHRGGHALREAGWQPFPNAYGLPGDAEMPTRLPYEFEEIPFEVMDRDDERVRSWSDRLPPLEQGEQLARLEATANVPGDAPYAARLFWEAPEDFRPPQLVAFRRGRAILVVPRAPERFGRGTREQTLFIIPPEFLERGSYEVFLSTEGRVNRWTFMVE